VVGCYDAANQEAVQKIKYHLLDLKGSGSWQLVLHGVWSVMLQLPETVG